MHNQLRKLWAVNQEISYTSGYDRRLRVGISHCDSKPHTVASRNQHTHRHEQHEPKPRLRVLLRLVTGPWQAETPVASPVATRNRLWLRLEIAGCDSGPFLVATRDHVIVHAVVGPAQIRAQQIGLNTWTLSVYVMLVYVTVYVDACTTCYNTCRTYVQYLNTNLIGMITLVGRGWLLINLIELCESYRATPGEFIAFSQACVPVVWDNW